MMGYQPQDGICPRCFDGHALKRDGTLRKHRRWVAPAKYAAPGTWGWLPCEGSGMPPTERIRLGRR